MVNERDLLGRVAEMVAQSREAEALAILDAHQPTAAFRGPFEFARAVVLCRTDRRREGMDILSRLVEREPGFTDARELLAELARHDGAILAQAPAAPTLPPAAPRRPDPVPTTTPATASAAAPGALQRARALLAERVHAGDATPELLATFADVLLRLGDVALATEILAAAADLHPRHRLAPARLAHLSRQQGKEQEAEAWARRAESRGDEVGPGASSAALACETLRAVIAAGVDDWQTQWALAQAASRSGRLDLVDEACAAVLQRNPEFWFARELPKHARGFYAQLGQDQVIEEFFRTQPPRHKAFVEVGAFDGKHYSNVRRLVEREGWSGVCIEPVAKNFRKLAASYEGKPVRCVRAAVGDEEGETDIHVSSYPHLPEWGSDVASLRNADRERWTATYGARWETERVPVRRLDSILRDEGVDGVDLVSIDCEGNDLEALTTLDLERFRPALLVVEHGEERQRVLEHACARGYSLLLDNGQDLVLARFEAGEGSPIATRSFSGLGGTPPYAEIQEAVERALPSFVGGSAAEVRTIVIVGGHHGREIPALLASYPEAEIHVFEANPQHFRILTSRFGREPRVHCVHAAVSNYEGEATFHETTIEGAGSLLPLKAEPDEQTWVPEGCRPGGTFSVRALKLDRHGPLAGKTVDLLWCDVQGAELKVLEGARDLLARCRALFLEVWTTKTLYQGQCRFGDLQAMLRPRAFHLAGIGLCHSGNGTGNALWVRAEADGRAAPLAAPPARVPGARAVTLAQARSVLNPHLFDVLPIREPLWHRRVPARDLLTPERLDLAAKALYARHRRLGVRSEWASRAYEAHLRCISGLREEDGSGKHGLQGYLAAFREVLDAVAGGGLDPRRSLVPIGRDHVIIDGAHRVAASLAYDRAVECLELDWAANAYGQRFFTERGLPEAVLDALAVEYARLKPNAHVAMLFPIARGPDDEARRILAEHGRIAYEKQILLENDGPAQLVRQLYRKERWIGTPEDGYRGARQDALTRFSGPGRRGVVRAFLLEAPDRQAVREAKERIRALYGVGNYAMHASDDHAEARELAGILFNANSLHVLNHARVAPTPRFSKHLAIFRSWLERRGLDPDHFAVDGSAILAAYGLRDAQDLDFLHFGHEAEPPPDPMVSSHNGEMAHHAYGRDDIIFDPAHHFTFDGVKFGALHVIREMKVRRGEAKDRQDVALVDALVGHRSARAAPGEPLPAHRAAPGGSGSRACAPASRKKLVALIPARNEEALIGFCVRAAAQFVDAIVFLDDHSEDRTVEIVRSLAAECRVERILTKDRWVRDEPGDRRRLLQAGREIGGTHFLSLDADEALTANGLEGGRMRSLLLGLAPGDALEMILICLWRGLGAYRLDRSVWSWNYKLVAFADDGASTFDSGFIHTARAPATLQGQRHRLEGYDMGLLHFQFVNWENLKVKQAWYRCLERIRDPAKPTAAINELYAPSTDERELGLRPAPSSWYAGYPFLDPSIFQVPDGWRKRQVRGWFEQYGREFFRDLQIWDVDWYAP